MVYDLIIIGAGAAGLFAGATLPSPKKGLILEGGAAPGKKLLLTGGGQCNLTHAGSIKEFLDHYGEHGKRIRTVLYRFSNQELMRFLESREMQLMEREDGKIFPKSLKARDLVDLLQRECYKNGLQIRCREKAIDLESTGEHFIVKTERETYQAKNVIVATGGASYPTTGSDGVFLQVAQKLGLQVVPQRPALVPLVPEHYPYGTLSGISFTRATVSILDKEGRKKATQTDGVLFTKEGFSGPAVLNLSRSAAPGDFLCVNYRPGVRLEQLQQNLIASAQGNNRQLVSVIHSLCNPDPKALSAEIPKRFLETMLETHKIDPTQKASQTKGAELRIVAKSLIDDRYCILKSGGFPVAMATAGGIDLSEIDFATMSCNKHRGLFFAGEVIDIDGDTGGYNLQFAFSSAYLAAQAVGRLDEH